MSLRHAAWQSAPLFMGDLLMGNTSADWVMLRNAIAADPFSDGVDRFLAACADLSVPGSARIWPAVVAHLRRTSWKPAAQPALAAIEGGQSDGTRRTGAAPKFAVVHSPRRKPWRNNSAEDLAKVGLTRHLAPCNEPATTAGAMLRVHAFLVVARGDVHNFTGLAAAATRLEAEQSLEAVWACLQALDGAFPALADEPLVFSLIKQLGEPSPENAHELDRLELAEWGSWAEVERVCLRYAVEFLMRLER